jgi:hypothetical protein
MEIFTLIIAEMTFLATIILGIFNYRINSQVSEVAKSFGKVKKKNIHIININNYIHKNKVETRTHLK